MEARARAGAPLVILAVLLALAPRAQAADEMRLGLLPGGELFAPLMADPRWPHFSAGPRLYDDDPLVERALATSIGEKVSVYRADAPFGGRWEIGALANVEALLDLGDSSLDLINADYTVGVFGAWRAGPWSVLAQLVHTSSHLGDELLLRQEIERRNVSFERFDLLASHDFGDTVRLYGGAKVLARRDPEELDRLATQVGIEIWPLGRPQKARPIVAADVQQREVHDWAADVSLRGGLELPGPARGAVLQLLLEYFDGRWPYGQFIDEHVEYVGLGLHLRF